MIIRYFKISFVLYLVIFICSFVAAFVKATWNDSLDRFIEYKLPVTLYSFVFGLLYSGLLILAVFIVFHRVKIKLRYKNNFKNYILGFAITFIVSIILTIFDHSTLSYVAFNLFLGLITGPIMNYLDDRYFGKLSSRSEVSN